MFKSVQVKIILIIAVLAIIMFIIPGYIYINQLANLELNGSAEPLIQAIQKGNFVFSILVTVFIVICLLIIMFTSKTIMNPIKKLINSAKKIAEGAEIEEIKYIEEKKTKTEIDELVSAFNSMTSRVKDNLNEVTRQKRQIETILLHVTDGIVAFNIDGNIIHINPAATRLLKITSKEDTFKKIFKKIKVNINMERIMYLENWTATETKINIDDVYLSLFFAPFKDENDRAAGVIVLVQDITEHVKLDNMRKEFVADVSHELKTPLTSIMGYAETLMASEYDKDLQEKFLNVISSEAVRMTKLVNDLLELSKFDNNKKETIKSEFDLGELVKQCQENLQIEMDKKKQKVECFVTANVPKVCADKDGIERVILNILSNSIKYTGEGGTIKIYVGFVYNDAYIKVIDNGIGIPEEDLNRIFDRFYRVDKARTREMGGTGLRTIYCKGNIR